MTPGAAWKDVTLGLRALGLFDGCAVVSDIGWVREASRLAGGPCPTGGTCWCAGSATTTTASCGPHHTHGSSVRIAAADRG